MRKVLLITFLFGLPWMINAQDSLRYSLESPYNTIYTHLSFLQEDKYHPEIAAVVFEEGQRTKEENIDLAVKLKQILDGGGHYIYVDEIPRDPNYTDSTTMRNTYQLVEAFPNIYVEKKGSRWLFSERSVIEIGRIHQDIYAYGTDKLLILLPKFGTKRIMGLHLWQHLGILILAFISFVIHKIFTLIFEKLILRFLRRSGYQEAANKYVLPLPGQSVYSLWCSCLSSWSRYYNFPRPPHNISSWV